MNSLHQDSPTTTNDPTAISTEKNLPQSNPSAVDLDQESSLPILGNRSLPPHRLHEKKSLAVVRYLDGDSSTTGNEA